MSVPSMKSAFAYTQASLLTTQRPLFTALPHSIPSALPRTTHLIHPTHHQSTRIGLFSSHHPRLPKIKTPDPFRTLNIPQEASYAQAKKSFLKIAMKHHPDTVGNECEKTREKSIQIFMKCRTALEMLVECDDTGRCLLRSEVEKTEKAEGKGMSDEEFDSWFKKETGHDIPLLDPEVMREVADMHEEMEGSHGLDRDGGMWHLASLIRNTVKTGKGGGAESILKLEAGSVKEELATGKLVKRRMRVRGRRR